MQGKPTYMKTTKTWITLLGLMPYFYAHAQFIGGIPMFESEMLCQAAAVPKALNGFAQNPAALSFCKASGFSIFQQSFVSVPALSLNSIAYKHGKKFIKGYSFTQFGTNFFRMYHAQMGLSKRIKESLAIGVVLQCQSIPTEEATPNITPAIGLGVCWKYNAEWEFGLNYNHPLSMQQHLNLAATWKPTSNLEWSVAVHKNGNQPQTLHSGLRYEVKSNFFVLTGFRVNPFMSAFGIAFPYKKIELGIGAQMFDLLGWKASFTLHYPIQ